MQYLKESPTELKILKEIAEVISLQALKNQEALMIEKIARYETDLAVIRQHISEAEKLGIVEILDVEVLL